MFIFTAKISKKKAVIFLILLAAVLCAIICTVGHMDRQKASRPAVSLVAKSEDDRLAFLKEYGWEVKGQPEILEILIPKDFSEVYRQYNSLQLSQGFDLSDYAGLEATKYTYEISNDKTFSGTVLCDMIVYKDCIIGGDIHATALDGFMHGFKMPE